MINRRLLMLGMVLVGAIGLMAVPAISQEQNEVERRPVTKALMAAHQENSDPGEFHAQPKPRAAEGDWALEAQRQTYHAKILAADAALAMNDTAAARRYLAAAPERLRNWEWRFLDASADQSLHVLRGHDDVVSSVAISADGKLAASGSWDGTVRIWDTSTGEQQSVLRGHEGRVWCVQFSPDGSRVATASEDRSVRIWRTSDGEQLFTLLGHKSQVWSLTFHPNGRTLASASADGTIRIWEVSTGVEEAILPRRKTDDQSGARGLRRGPFQGGRGGSFQSVAFSPNGARLATATGSGMIWVTNGSVGLWDPKTGEEVSRIVGHDGSVLAVAFSPDGSRIASGSRDKTIRIWDVDTQKELAVLRGHNPLTRAISFSSGGDYVASGAQNNSLKLWDSRTGKVSYTLRGHEGSVYAVASSLDGTRLATASWDGTIRLWAVPDHEQPAVLRQHDDAVQSVAFSPDGTRLVSASQDQTVRLWDTTTHEELAVLRGHKGPVGAVSFSSDGTILASASGGIGVQNNNTIRVWDALTGTLRQVLGVEGRIVSSPLAISPDSTRIAAACHGFQIQEYSVRIWDVSSGREQVVLSGHKNRVRGIAFTPDGKRLATSSQNEVRFWDVATGNQLATFPGPVSVSQTRFEKQGHYGFYSLGSIAVSPDGSRLAVASSRFGIPDSTVRIWDAATGVEQVVIRASAQSVAFNPDGTRIVSGSGNTLRLWDTSTGEQLIVLRGHEDFVLSVAYSSDGDRVASASRDGTIRIWDSVPNRRRFRERQTLLDAQPEAARVVDDLSEELKDWTLVAERLRKDGSLSAPLRRAAFNLVLRRATGHPDVVALSGSGQNPKKRGAGIIGTPKERRALLDAQPEVTRIGDGQWESELRRATSRPGTLAFTASTRRQDPKEKGVENRVAIAIGDAELDDFEARLGRSDQSTFVFVIMKIIAEQGRDHAEALLRAAQVRRPSVAWCIYWQMIFAQDRAEARNLAGEARKEHFRNALAYLQESYDATTQALEKTKGEQGTQDIRISEYPAGALRAYASLEFARKHMPDLPPTKRGGYAWLAGNLESIGDYELPEYETWSRLVRKGTEDLMRDVWSPRVKQNAPPYMRRFRVEMLREMIPSLHVHLALAALEAGELAAAKRHVSELLKNNTNPKSGNDAHVSHRANEILGRVALREGNLAEAKRFLLKAGQTPGSAVLNSYGPSMYLAEELSVQGEREVVLAYFCLCSKFWKSDRNTRIGGGRLNEWSRTILEDRIPDFGRKSRGASATVQRQLKTKWDAEHGESDKQGGLMLRYPNGKKLGVGTFEDGKPHGEFTTWYENGQKWLEWECQMGKRQGKWTDWYDNGKKWAEGQYLAGKKHGETTYWNEDGQITLVRAPIARPGK